MQRLLKKLIGGIVAAVVLVSTASRTHAAAYTYNQSSRTVNAGILLFDTTTPVAAPAAGPQNIAPYLFYVFNQRADVKPIGWNVVNPLAPPTVTQDILTRWDNRTAFLQSVAVTAGISGYKLGQPVTPDMAPYWEIFLSKVTLKQLRKYDILFIGTDSTLGLRERDKETLREYVDAGGQILVDASISPSPVAAPGNLFFDINTASTGANSLNANLLQFNNVPFLHPLVSVPYLMSFELNSLGFGNVKQYVTDASSPPFLGSVVFHGDPAQNKPVIAAAQLGAGQVIAVSTGTASAINDYVGMAGYTGPGSNRGPFCGDNLQAASIPDMKLLANVISWSGVQGGEFHDSHNNSFVNEPLAAAVTRTWSYPTTQAVSAAAHAMPGAAIYGRYVVTTDINGVVHCFDAFPRESLNSTGNPDDGTPDFFNGTSYDEIWKGALPGRAASPYTSAPTVALVPQVGGPDIPVVFVEAANGQLFSTSLIQSTSPVTWTVVTASGAATNTYAGENYNLAARTVPGYAPAPTFYRGILFATDGGGRLFTKSYIGGYSTAGTYHNLSPASGGPGRQYGTAPPTVYLNETKDTNDSRVNDITVVVSTNKFIYTTYVGTYGDALTGTYPTLTGSRLQRFGAPAQYSVDDNTGLFSLFSTNGSNVVTATGNVTPVSNTFNFTSGVAPFYADYFANLAAGKPVGIWQSVGTSQYPWARINQNFIPYVSAVAVDSNNNQYYTVTATPNRSSGLAPVEVTPHSALASVHVGGDSGTNLTPGNGQMSWRFRMPSQADGRVVDADGVLYGDPAGSSGGTDNAGMRLTDFVFSGAPVIDRNGLAYAVGYYLRTTGPTKNQFAVVCFDTNKSVTADISVPAGANPGSVQTPIVQQPVPATAGPTGNTEFGLPVTSSPAVTQGTNFTADGNGHIVFTNFMSQSVAPAPINVDRFPALSEPQGVSITFNAVSGGTMTNYSQTVPLHTNLVWMTIGDFATVGRLTGSSIPNGLTVVGDYAFFGDNIGNKYRAYIHPQSDGMVGADRFVPRGALNHVGIPEVAAPEYTGLAGVMGVPSSSNGTMVLTGPNGIVAYQSLRTLGADQDRVFETDADGNLLWAVDGTTKNGVAGGAIGGTGHAVASRMNFRDATSVSQLDANSYLAADTGNNRVVEFDKSGNVINEITRFNDTATPGLLTAGQPDTLNHPTSLVAWRTFSKVAGLGVSTVHYLIADTGNYRVLQVADDFNQAGQVLNFKPHRLEWISHTYDALGRKYAYSAADIFWDTDKQPYVVALVNSTAIAPFTPSLKNQATLPLGQMAPIASDAPGGSVVKLDYNTDATHKAGYIHVTSVLVAGKPVNYLNTVSQFFGYTRNLGGYTGYDVGTGASDTTGTNTNARFQLQNPRFLHVNTAPGVAANSSIQDLLITDDNGAFDMYFNGTPFVAPLVAKWGMLQADYQNMNNGGVFVKAFSTDTLPAASINRRANMRFVPTSIAAVGVDFVNNLPVQRYLIAQSSGEGDVNAAEDNPPVAPATVAGAPAQKIGGEIFVVAHDPSGVPLYGGYGGATLSRPGNGGALEHPSSASLPVP